MRCIREEKPGPKWLAIFDSTWPYYRKWFLKEGENARPGYLDCRAAIDRHMPEFSRLYRELGELVGGGDLAARFLSMYRPPRYMGGCTQVAWTRGDLALIRNYDYDPRWFEGVLLQSNWLRPVMGVSDCNWGLLDGMNGDGLAASLTFGGRDIAGDGFGIPLVLRYVLETCPTVEAALEALRRLPVHMAYNVMLVDRSGDHAIVFLGPDRQAGVVRGTVCSNHQESIDWPEYAEATGTEEREALAKGLESDPGGTCADAVAGFLRPPLHCSDPALPFGTLYTAAWYPARSEMRMSWPSRSMRQSFTEFKEKRIVVNLRGKSEMKK